MRSRAWRTVTIGSAGALFLLCVLTLKGVAQSEYMSGQGFPYGAFDRLPATDVAVQGGVIHLAFAPGRIDLPKPTIEEWVRRSAKAITTYYGRFPVKSARILIVPSPGAGVQGGTTWGYRGGAIRIVLGSDATEDDLRRDWVMVHEMVHLALPDMEERYAWLSEGLAVYIEPIARVQSGDLPAASVWSVMMRDMPKGLPGPGDRGLDNTSAWGRKYWGGAIFCLLADVQIRERSNNLLGLQDAMRAVLVAGGNHEVDWSISKVLSVADAATGLNVLTSLHDSMGSKAVRPDLEALWLRLGLKHASEGVEIDPTAPLASTLAAITPIR